MITENRTRKCMNCAYGHSIIKGSMYCLHPFHYGASNEPTHHCLNCAFGKSIVAGKMYCAHPMHYGRMNEITHGCVNWKDRRHGMSESNESD